MKFMLAEFIYYICKPYASSFVKCFMIVFNVIGILVQFRRSLSLLYWGDPVCAVGVVVVAVVRECSQQPLEVWERVTRGVFGRVKRGESSVAVLSRYATILSLPHFRGRLKAP